MAVRRVPDKAELAQVKPERGFQAIGFVAVRDDRIIVGRGVVDPREVIVVVDQLRPEAGDFKAVAAATNWANSCARAGTLTFLPARASAAAA